MRPFRDIIFGLFGTADKVNDVDKDIHGKGTNERYNEIIGKDIDENLIPKIENLVEHNVDPNTALSAYLVYLENKIGGSVLMRNTDVWRRRMLKYSTRLHAIRSTKRCYTLMLKWLGLTVVITESFGQYGFDSPVTFDDSIRVFDLHCAPCSSYTLEITGPGALTDELEAAILNVIEYNEPINGILAGWSYTEVEGMYGDGYGGSYD